MSKTILITGAGRGIGRAAALALAQQGHQVVLVSRTMEELQALEAEIAQAGGQALVLVCDVRDEQAVQAMFEQTLAWSAGELDMLICAAGVARVASLSELSLQAWNESLDVNLTGTFLCCRYAVPHMRSGSMIVALSSIAGKTGFPGWSAYSAAKFGLMGFTQAIREELRPQGIRVTTLVPGAVDTPLWEDVPGTWNRENMLQATEVAATIAYLATLPEHIQVDELVLGHVVGKL